MGYIGAQPATNFETVRKQVSTTNSGTTITLDFAVSSVQDILVTVNAVVQSYDNYSVSGTTLTLGGTLNNDRVEILYVGRTFQTVTPAIGTVTNDMLSGSIANSKLANSSITLNGSAVSLGGSATTPSGDLVRLYSLADNTSSVTNITIDNVFSADYDDYLVLGDLTSASTAQNLRYKFRDGSGDRADSEYDHRMLFATTGTSSGTQNSISATGQDYGRLTDSSNNDTTRVSARIALHIFNPYSASRRASITMTNRHLSSGADVGYTFGVNDYKNATQLTGIKFYWASGNVSQSRINIYGYKKA